MRERGASASKRELALWDPWPTGRAVAGNLRCGVEWYTKMVLIL